MHGWNAAPIALGFVVGMVTFALWLWWELTHADDDPGDR